MAHFAYLAAPGSFVNGYVPSPSLWETLNDQQYKAVNGDDGGSWSPAAAIVVGGAGITLSGTTHKILSGAELHAQSGGYIKIDAGAELTVNGSIYCTNIITVSGGAITLASSGSMGVNSGCGITFANGSILTAQAGSALNISGVITAKGATQYKLDARAVTRTFSANRYSVLAFQAAHIGLSSAIIQINTTYTDEYVSFDLPLPNGCTLTSVSVGIKAALHGASWPPAGPFQIRVQKKNITTGALTTIVLQNDSVAVQATYEAYHLLTATCSEVIDRTTYTYFAEVNVENGANATTLGEVHDCKATFTVDTVDEGN
jgi:hypothetical protein